MMIFKTYSELSTLSTFEERFRYLMLNGTVGDASFGHERYLNQHFYNSAAWKKARDVIIVRDNGDDLGIPGRRVHGAIYIHHINPLTPEDLRYQRPCLVDPDNLISVSHQTHNAIHWGDESQLIKDYVPRTPGDNKEW